MSKDQEFVATHLSVNKDTSLGTLRDNRFTYQGTMIFIDQATNNQIIQKLLANSAQENSISFGSFLNFSNEKSTTLLICKRSLQA